ncbi:twin-arginine translocase TatA/TatE family subunit [Metallosphaera hakonensis]|uniref:Translocase n=1 Tax=Metallosphaera hakonensis JCM 8857 = DSM 7519 TaxID=1293036 RepID=A0A2U9IWR2_9CREN|nr:twin-arginine translocase TatA/TatE family subunit [Metallosphaera hakonensis]AWS00500.1 translocase [Metallosphaera hakonensis JCM 8857 = DSM 7519]
MIGSLSDALIMIIVAILLLGGEKNLSGTMRNLGRTLSELRKRQNDFKNELMRELSDTGEVTQDIKGSLSFDSEIRPMVKSVSKVNYQPVDPKIQQLENEIRRLQAELERLKKGDGKN